MTKALRVVIFPPKCLWITMIHYDNKNCARHEHLLLCRSPICLLIPATHSFEEIDLNVDHLGLIVLHAGRCGTASELDDMAGNEYTIIDTTPFLTWWRVTEASVISCAERFSSFRANESRILPIDEFVGNLIWDNASHTYFPDEGTQHSSLPKRESPAAR